MARTVRDAKLETRAARSRLTVQAKPHWRCLVPSQLHLGYRRRRRDAPGTWIARRYLGLDQSGVGRYASETLGIADDYNDADGRNVLSFADAQQAAHERAKIVAADRARPLTIAAAIDDYLAFLRLERKTVGDAESRARTHILPQLGELEVNDLTTDRLVRWRDAMAGVPARARTRPGQIQKYKRPAETDDERRARRATVNRTVTVLKAALNRAFHNGRVHDDKAWRRLKPYRAVNAARPGFLTITEAQRLIQAADALSGFRALLHAALLTGCRYGELCALAVGDFERGRVIVRQAKSGKPRDVRLSDEGRSFFSDVCAGRDLAAPMLPRAGGGRWGKSQQARPMLEACKVAGVAPIGFHQLRHTWASHSVMNGMPLLVVSSNLGHSDTRMVEIHYGHLTDSYVDEAVRLGAPQYMPKALVGTTSPSKEGK